ncbi:Exosome complex component CSL4 [Clonorchis sinensis]|uniref:Exosome complex component CSL4 n=1 Tax=Clonorchis sinensis TaxID=79923 RepID=A0A8T1M7L4_CLOSI|nr:Exosome complex component CSL4 [Clonorchis sinensis]
MKISAPFLFEDENDVVCAFRIEKVLVRGCRSQDGAHPLLLTLISSRTMFDKHQDIFFPGDSIVQKDDRHRCGPFTHISGGQIRANCMGRIKRCTSDGVTVVELVPLKAPGVVPYAGAIVLAKVSSLSRRIVRCDVVAVGNTPLAGPFRGMLRREDIRATQRDQAEPAQCYRPGDLIRARVINLLGPGSTPESTFLSGQNVSSAAATTLLAARAVSVSVGATTDISGGLASNAVCLLSTAEPDLGVVLGLGRAPDSDFAELLGSTSGCPLIPVSWTEMLCPHTLSRFPRKVARVSDELLTQLVKTEVE